VGRPRWQRAIDLVLELARYVGGTEASVREAATLLGFLDVKEESTQYFRCYKHEISQGLKFMHGFGAEEFTVFLNQRWIDHEKQSVSLDKAREYYASRFERVRAYLILCLGNELECSTDQQCSHNRSSRWNLGKYDVVLRVTDVAEYNSLFVTLAMELKSLRYFYEGRWNE